MKLVCDFLRNLALDCEHFAQVAIVFFRPYVSVSAGVDQLRIQTNSRSVSAYASFQHMGDTQRITDPARILLAPILHDAGAADHFEIGDFRQFGQNVVLHAVGEKCVLFVVAEIFKWQHCDAGCDRMVDQFAFPNDHG